MVTKQHEHDQMIKALCAADPDVRQHGFWKAVKALSDELENEEYCKWPFLPDAYKINRETCEIEIHEVVRTNDITHEKLVALGSMWFFWDSEGHHDWLPVLFVHRKFFEPQRMDLEGAYFTQIDEFQVSPP